jgi:putative membrane protein
VIPHQKLEKANVKRENYLSSFLGTISGSLVGFLPGVTSGVAAVISRLFIRNEESDDFLFALGSVNTANYIFNLAALYILLRPRSGAVNSISQIYTVDRWYSTFLIPTSFILILITVVLSSILAFFLTLKIGKFFAVNIEKLGRRYGHVSRILIAAIFIFVFLFTGVLGIVFLVIATLIGVLPPKLGIMRAHLMGVIMLPVLFFYL